MADLSIEKVDSRELNEIEYLNYSFGQPYNIAIVISLKGSLIIDRLKAAILKCQIRHPLMQAQVWSDKNGIPRFYFNHSNSIPLEIKNFQNGELIDEVFKNQLETPFEMGEEVITPLIRFIYFRGTDRSALMICAQHIITDGFSMVFLIRDLFRMINNPSEELSIEEQLKIPQSNIDLFPIEIRKKIRSSATRFNRIVSFLRIMQKLMTLKQRRKGKENIGTKTKFDARTWQILPFSLNSHETRDFLTRCKEEKVSVHSAICTAFINRFPIILSPVSLRNMLKIPIETAFGMYVWIVTIKMRYNQKINFWENARHFQKLLKNKMNPNKIFKLFSLYGICKAVSVEKIKEVNEIGLKLQNYQEESLVITNLMSLDSAGIPLSGETYDIIEFDGATTLHQINSKVISVYTLNGELHIQFHYFASNNTRESVEQIVENAMKLLRLNI